MPLTGRSDDWKKLKRCCRTSQLIRTLVRRVEIDRNHVEIIFRVPPPAPETSRPLEPPSDRKTWHHCTDDQHLHCGTPGPLGGVHTIKAIHLS
jgi:hypothetical protein